MTTSHWAIRQGQTAVYREVNANVGVFYSENGALEGRIVVFTRKRGGSDRLTVDDARRLIEYLQEAVERSR